MAFVNGFVNVRPPDHRVLVRCPERLADWLPLAHPLNPTAGTTSKAPAIIAGLTIRRAYPKTTHETTAVSAI
jgi:hypothetical protein